MNNVEFRLIILKNLYEMNQADGPKKMKNYDANFYPKISNDNFKFNVQYLIDKGYVSSLYGYNRRKDCNLTITSSGIDIVEFYILGLSFDKIENEDTLQKLLSKALNLSGQIAKSSTLALINQYLSKFLQ